MDIDHCVFVYASGNGFIFHCVSNYLGFTISYLNALLHMIILLVHCVQTFVLVSQPRIRWIFVFPICELELFDWLLCLKVCLKVE
jgi:hypothetical protein